jgi:hypothetical protein
MSDSLTGFSTLRPVLVLIILEKVDEFASPKA